MAFTKGEIIVHMDDYVLRHKYRRGVLNQDHEDMCRKYLKGTQVVYKRTKDYEMSDGDWSCTTHGPKWTGQFRTHYIGVDENGQLGSFTIFYLGLIVDKQD